MAFRMQCSDKNVIIPEGIPASIVQRALLEDRGEGQYNEPRGGRRHECNSGEKKSCNETKGKRTSGEKQSQKSKRVMQN